MGAQMNLKTLEGKDLFASLSAIRKTISTLQDQCIELGNRIIDADNQLDSLGADYTRELADSYRQGVRHGEEAGYQAGLLDKKQNETEI